MEFLVILIVLLIVIAGLVAAGKLKVPAPSSSINYRLSGPLFSPAERSFLGVLIQATPEDNLVMGKVRVADVISPEKGLSKPKWQSAFNRISSKHFDYVICDRATLRVISAVELNDKSHRVKKRSRRDEFLRAACESAGLRLLEFDAKGSYSVVEVRKQLADEASDASPFNV